MQVMPSSLSGLVAMEALLLSLCLREISYVGGSWRLQWPLEREESGGGGR